MNNLLDNLISHTLANTKDVNMQADIERMHNFYKMIFGQTNGTNGKINHLTNYYHLNEELLTYNM